MEKITMNLLKEYVEKDISDKLQFPFSLKDRDYSIYHPANYLSWAKLEDLTYSVLGGYKKLKRKLKRNVEELLINDKLNIPMLEFLLNKDSTNEHLLLLKYFLLCEAGTDNEIPSNIFEELQTKALQTKDEYVNKFIYTGKVKYLFPELKPYQKSSITECLKSIKAFEFNKEVEKFFVDILEGAKPYKAHIGCFCIGDLDKSSLGVFIADPTISVNSIQIDIIAYNNFNIICRVTNIDFLKKSKGCLGGKKGKLSVLSEYTNLSIKELFKIVNKYFKKERKRKVDS